MSLTKINWNPNRKEIRNFGIIALIASIIVSLLLYFIKGIALKWIAVVVTVGLMIFLCSLISIKVTRAIYRTLMAVTFPIGLTISFILMALFYFLLITPTALLFRMLGRDLLHRRFEPDVTTYWSARRATPDAERYFHQF